MDNTDDGAVCDCGDPECGESSLTDEQAADYYEHVTVHVGLMPDCELVEHPKGGFMKARVWLHTNGMARYNRPELEMVDVDPQYAPYAFERLNSWAMFSAFERELEIGSSIVEGDDPIFPMMTLEMSTLPYWEEVGRACLTFKFVATAIGTVCDNPECAGCSRKH